jgi:hypothetical protein
MTITQKVMKDDPRLAEPYHFLVTTAAYWKTHDSLLTALEDIRREDDVAICANMWRIPGSAKGTAYEINFYVPQIEGAVFLGSTPIGSPKPKSRATKGSMRGRKV